MLSRCAQFPMEAMHRIKEVEMVDSVDDLKSSSSERGIQMPIFEVLNARITSALNRFIHNSHFKRRISLEEQKAQKQDRFLRGRQEYFFGSQEPRVLSKIMPTIHFWSSKWRYSGIRFKVWRNFYNQWQRFHLMTSWKDCTNWEYEILRNSRPCWNCTRWRFIRRKPDLIFTDWRQWWKEVSNKTFELRILAPEIEIMKEKPWSRIWEQNSVHKFLEIVGNGKPTFSALKETNVVSVTI